MEAPIGWGIIGAGMVCEKKSGPAFYKSEHSRLVGVMRRDAAKARDFAERHGVPFSTANAEELIQHPQVQAVYVATPPNTHAYYAEMALNAGKPVYVEKPMGLSFAECERMAQLAHQKDLPLFVAFYRRSLEKYRLAKKCLEEGAIGRPLSANIRLIVPRSKAEANLEARPWLVDPAVSGGGFFWDLAPHQLDLLAWYFGPFAEAAGMEKRRLADYQAADTVSACFAFQNGVSGTGHWCFVADKTAAADETLILGEKGSLRFSTFDEGPLVLENEDGQLRFERPFPEHVQQPLIKAANQHLLGQGFCPSTSETALSSAWAMEAISGGHLPSY